MKKLSVMLLLSWALPIHAQGLLGALNQYQESIVVKNPSSTSGNSSSQIKPPTISSSTTSARCEQDDQTSLPLAYVTSLITERDAALNFVYDSRAGVLNVTAPPMISNCSSMLEWNVRQTEIAGAKTYALEVKIKESSSCTSAGCTYKVAKVDKGVFQKHEDMVFKPNLKGFEECLEKSGVIVDGKVAPGSIYGTPVNEKFNGINDSGKLLFVSNGPATPLVKAKYGKFDPIDRCDHYEQASPDITQLLSYSDAERARLDAEAALLKDCTIDEYHKVADFLEKYENYSAELVEVRDRLILDAAKASAKAMTDGKYSDDDLKVMADFEKYIVTPKILLARRLYDEMLDLEGDSKKAKQNELRHVLAEIANLNKAPYFTTAHTHLLMKDGQFEDAERLNGIKLMLGAHQRLGARENNVVITPELAESRVAAGRVSFTQHLVKEREYYEIRTGQTAGKSGYYSGLASRMRENIETRTKNYNEEIDSEVMRVHNHCPLYWVNTELCKQDSEARFYELQAFLNHYNEVDNERATEYEAKAKKYKVLEAEGRRYIAAQNGEAPEEVVTTLPAESNNLGPGSRPAERNGQQGPPGTYAFNFNQGSPEALHQAQMQPHMHMNPTNPYVQQNMFQQQNPYNLGQYSQYAQQGMSQQQLPQHQQPFLGQHAYDHYGVQGNNTGFMHPHQQPQSRFNFHAGYQFGAHSGQQNMPWGQQMPIHQGQHMMPWGQQMMPSGQQMPMQQGHQIMPWAQQMPMQHGQHIPYAHQSYMHYNMYGR